MSSAWVSRRWLTKFEPMKPAPPVTSSFIPVSPSGSSASARPRLVLLVLLLPVEHRLAEGRGAGAAGGGLLLGGRGLAAVEVVGQAALPVGEGDRGAAAAAEDGVGRALGGPLHHVGGRGHHPGHDLGLAEDLHRELVPRAASAAGHVVDAEDVGVDQANQAVGQVAGVGGAADLVVDDDDGAAARRRGAASSRRSCRRAGPKSQEVRTMKLRRVGEGGRALAGELRAAVGVDRGRVVVLGVRARAWCRRRRSRSRRRGPWRRRSPRSWRRTTAPSPFTSSASCSLVSAPSTSVHAAQLTTAAGRWRPNARSTRLGSVTSRSSRVSATTSCPWALAERDDVAARASPPLL